MEEFGRNRKWLVGLKRKLEDKKVWNQRGWDYLKKLRYSRQSPRPKQRKGDPEQQEKFIQALPLKVKKLEEQYPEAEVDL